MTKDEFQCSRAPQLTEVLTQALPLSRERRGP